MTNETYLLVKLVNGEEVVGEVISSDDATEMLMYRPMLVDDSAISRYHFFAEDEDYVSFRRSSIVSTTTPRPSYIKFYLHCVSKYDKSVNDKLDRSIELSISNHDKDKESYLMELLGAMMSTGNNTIQ
jgi:small nuclear ribonucleoprotein (snRNP)-like protein